MRNSLHVFTLVSLMAVSPAFAGQQDAAVGFDSEMEALGINMNRPDMSCLPILRELINTDYQTAKNAAKNGDKDAKADARFLKQAGRVLDRQWENPAEAEAAYVQAVKLLYTLAGKQAVDDEIAGVETDDGQGFVQKVIELFTKYRTSKQWIPLPEKDPTTSFDGVGLEQAQKEAYNLVDPSNPGSYLTPEQLAQLTYHEISELDIPDFHPQWHSKNTRTSNPWDEMVERTNAHTAAKLQKKLVENRPDNGAAFVAPPPVNFDVRTAHKVLFVNRVKNSATSPKVNTKDAFGEKWKLKWGTEIHIEPVVNRLWMKAGGKVADLTFGQDRGFDGPVLILEEEGGILDSRGKFENALMTNYGFNLAPHMYETGVITRNNIDVVLQNYPDSEYTKLKKEDLLGRVWITFKGSMVEFKGDAGLKRGGPVGLSQAFANDDRVARGLVALNQWIGNADAKDDNSRAVLATALGLEEDNLIMGVLGLDVDGKSYGEMQHDMGVALGHPVQKGNPNTMDTGTAFAGIKKRGLFGLTGDRAIYFDQFMLYRPQAWDYATYSDARWMVLQLVHHLDRQTIYWATGASRLPDFWREAVTDRLLSRLKTLADIFNVPQPEPAEPRQIFQSLHTRQDRLDAAAKYEIRVEDIEQELMRIGALNRTSPSTSLTEDWYKGDMLYSNGHINRCNNTIMMGLMVEQRHPSGIARRLMPRFDKTALPTCRYGDRMRYQGLGDRVGKIAAKVIPAFR